MTLDAGWQPGLHARARPSATTSERRHVPVRAVQPSAMNQVILLEDGWNKLKTGGVMKIEQILEDMQDSVYKNHISTEEYSALYTYAAARRRRAASHRPPTPPRLGPCAGGPRGGACALHVPGCIPSGACAHSLCSYAPAYARLSARSTVYTMCTQKPPNNWSEHLYNNYCDAVKDYLSARILPRIKEKHDEAMLKELVRRWENHKLMIKFLSHVFKYLDRFYVKRLSLPELAEVGAQTSRSLPLLHTPAALAARVRVYGRPVALAAGMASCVCVSLGCVHALRLPIRVRACIALADSSGCMPSTVRRLVRRPSTTLSLTRSSATCAPRFSSWCAASASARSLTASW